MERLDLDLVRHALKAARRHKMGSVELEYEGVSLSATLSPRHRRSKGSTPDAGETAVEVTEFVKSPFVGYYGDPEPALSVGQRVEAGSVVAIVSILGIANEVEAPIGGEVVEILVRDGQPVEFGQALVRLRVL
jgi:biotin carboxyl carrier protein